MNIRFTTRVGEYGAGEVHDFDDIPAKQFIAAGVAELVVKPLADELPPFAKAIITKIKKKPKPPKKVTDDGTDQG